MAGLCPYYHPGSRMSQIAEGMDNILTATAQMGGSNNHSANMLSDFMGAAGPAALENPPQGADLPTTAEWLETALINENLETEFGESLYT